MSGASVMVMGAAGDGRISVQSSMVLVNSGVPDALTLNTNGSITASNEGFANWFTPTTVGIGSLYWCKMVLNSGSNPTTGTMNTVLALSSARAWTWNAGVVGTYTLTFYTDAAGTQLVGTSAVSSTG